VRSSTAFGVALVSIWVLAWGSLTWANLVSGVVVCAVLYLAVPEMRHAGHRVVVRPVPLARLAGRYLWDVVASNAQVAREVLRLRPRLSTAVVRVPLDGCTDEMLTALANLVIMTPGTMPVEVERDPPAMYVHVLHFSDVGSVRQDVWSLRDQVLAAFGTREALAAAARESSEPGEGTP
jgi:multicomponent Na+:H+ antiporter subunit E